MRGLPGWLYQGNLVELAESHTNFTTYYLLLLPSITGVALHVMLCKAELSIGAATRCNANVLQTCGS